MNKEEWEIKKLGEVCIIERGGSPRPISQYITNDKNGINWIKIGDAESHSRTIKTTKEKIKPEGMSKSRYVHKGDFLLSNSMSFGRPYILDIDGCIHDGWLVIRDLNDVFDKNYLYYFLSSPITSLKFKSLAVGGVVNNLNSSMIKNLDVLIPPLPFQEKIVKELDLLSNIIAKKKEQVKELDKLAQSAFYDMFGDPLKNQKRWSLMNLKEICSSIIRGPFGSALKKDFFVPKSDSAYKVYEQKHAIQKNKTIGNYYIDEQLYNTLKRFTVYPRDIIMSCSGTIGEFFEIPYDAEKGIINQALLKFTLLPNKINNTYFLFLMKYIILDIDRKGSGIQNIGSVKFIKEINLGIPPLSLQNQFAERIQAIEKQKELINQSIKEVQLLFDYTMNKYFN